MKGGRVGEALYEALLKPLQELNDANAGRQLSRDAIRKKLSEAELHISDATIEYLLRGQHAAAIDMDAVCWRTAKKTIQNILRTKWNVLMRQFRLKDPLATRRLARDTIEGVLGRADVGMSASLIEIVMGNLNVEDDSRIDYDQLLSGRMKRETFNMDVYVAYKTMEQQWEQLSQHFWDFDVNADGKVSDDEFRQALRSLNIPTLSDVNVLDQLILHLEQDKASPDAGPTSKIHVRFVDFDKFSWEMAREDLKRVVAQRGAGMRRAFREEANMLYSNYKGQVPRDKAITAIYKAVHDLGVREILIKILISNAQTRKVNVEDKAGAQQGQGQGQAAQDDLSQRASAGQGAGRGASGGAGLAGEQVQQGKSVPLVSEALLMQTLRELAGDSFDKEEQDQLRQQFLEIGRASGSDSSEPRKIFGSASIGQALAWTGTMPLRRVHMNRFGNRKSILRSLLL